MRSLPRAAATAPAALVLTVLLALGLLGGVAPAADAQEPPAVDVRSGRADQVVGGDALLAITGMDAPLQVSVDDGPAVPLPATDHDGVLHAELTGLALGPDRAPLTQQVLVTDADGDTAGVEVTNHPTEGPVFSGQHIQPWSCGSAQYDERCNYRQTEYAFQYVPAGGDALQPVEDPSTLSEGDWATTTTDEGVEVPFVVRVETGALDRDQYRIASLVDPADPYATDGADPYVGFNGKLVLNHGASCDTQYGTASAPGVVNTDVLARGFAVASHALNNAGHNCNLLTQAESLVMTKERVAEQLGAIRYTIGYGCSGGALVQQQVAGAFPGIYQGISPACSFADAWSTAQQYIDYFLLRQYFEQPQRWAPGVVWHPQAIEAAYGHPNVANPITFTTAIPNSGEPTRSCTSQAPGVYDEVDNPTGVRCTLQDYMVNAFGIHGDLDGDGEVDFPVASTYDAAADAYAVEVDYPVGTTPEEQAAFEADIVDYSGDVIAGFARRPYDNAGILYGLSGLLDGTMTPAQFVDLNVKVGGGDYDLNPTPARVEADPTAIERIFRTGAVNSGEHMDQVAIIDRRGPDPGAFHDVYRTYVMRERLYRSNGHADNQVLWQGPVALLGDVTFETASIFALDAWLAEVEAMDGGFDAPGLEDRIRAARTTAGVDHRCTDGAGGDLPYAIDLAGTPSGRLLCDTIAEDYTAPRIQAGAPLTDDHIACQRTPLDVAGFRLLGPDGQPTAIPIPFTDAQVAALEAVFPGGVCDYSVDPAHLDVGPDGLRTDAWLDYGDATGTVYGGARLADAPTSTPAAAAPSDPAGRQGLTDPYLVERITGS